MSVVDGDGAPLAGWWCWRRREGAHQDRGGARPLTVPDRPQQLREQTHPPSQTGQPVRYAAVILLVALGGHVWSVQATAVGPAEGIDVVKGQLLPLKLDPWTGGPWNCGPPLPVETLDAWVGTLDPWPAGPIVLQSLRQRTYMYMYLIRVLL